MSSCWCRGPRGVCHYWWTARCTTRVHRWDDDSRELAVSNVRWRLAIDCSKCLYMSHQTQPMSTAPSNSWTMYARHCHNSRDNVTWWRQIQPKRQEWRHCRTPVFQLHYTKQKAQLLQRDRATLTCHLKILLIGYFPTVMYSMRHSPSRDASVGICYVRCLSVCVSHVGILRKGRKRNYHHAINVMYVAIRSLRLVFRRKMSSWKTRTAPNTRWVGKFVTFDVYLAIISEAV